jgi:uncharacterized protein (DUF697 family)
MANTQPHATLAEQTIRKHMLAALGAGLVPLPWLDAAALAGLQLNLVRCLAEIYGTEFSAQLSKAAIAGLSGGGLSVYLSAGLAGMAKTLPGIGWVVGAGSVALLGAASTYAVGRVFVQHFEAGGTLLSFDPEKMRAYYASQYEHCKEEARKNFAGYKP